MTDKVISQFEYSKSSSFYLTQKYDYFYQNDELLNEARRKNQIYMAQPRRFVCKLCQKKLPEMIDFISHGVGYTFCPGCAHLNGIFDDTEEFVEKLYISDNGKAYSTNYIDKDFTQRVNDIYVPKIDFLIKSLPAKNYRLLDVGCGSGYLVYAAFLRNMAAEGIDVNSSMIDFGNRQILHFTPKLPLRHICEDDFYDSIVNADVEIISAIGVIEHLRNPHLFFDAFKQSKASYLYYSVPMFSLSVFLESVFIDVLPRQLSGGHTHLFTEDSLQKMNALLDTRTIAEWRFGTDIVDLYRSIIVFLRKNNCSAKMQELLAKGFENKIDEMQSVLDKNHFCSEIHCVVEKN